MTEKMAALLDILKARQYRDNRSDTVVDITGRWETASPMQKAVCGLCAMLEAEQPRFIPNDDIGFYRTICEVPHPPHEPSVWGAGNITPNYGRILTVGLDATAADIRARLADATPSAKDFYGAALTAIDAVCTFAGRYAIAAKAENPRLHTALSQVPHRPARTFYEACVFLKLLIFALRCHRVAHVTLGHFDRYMYPFFERDMAAGVPEAALLETLENFFLSINFDTDLYPGIQQGDNGQSMVLGGRIADGTYEFNTLAHLCMQASLELTVIDPKINMRVCRDTPFDLYLLGTEMTKKGLGFPQYCNDDVVIPGLTALGYDYADAVNYTVAACWEYIVPDCGMDIPNIVTMNFPLVVDRAVRAALPGCNDFDALLAAVKKEIAVECDALVAEGNGYTLAASPFLSVMVDGCVESGRDLSEGGAKYNHSGCHGAGIANAADALAAIKKTVFEQHTVTAAALIKALDDNFEGHTALWHELLACPKTGNNDDYVDDIAGELLSCFCASMNGRPNNRGGIYRAGTGSAMEYIISAARVGATADGRRAYTPYSSSFSPSITATLNGPLSVMQSFTKFDMQKIINGGPLTMEFHSNTFRNEMGIEKVAQLVKWFVDNGGHQLQLNAINRDRLLDAKKHPEEYPNLIVRVWGWSGYFNELAPAYQDHIIRRAEFTV